jgi:hypothetical protein
VNAVDSAGQIDCPLLLLAGSENKIWMDSNELCYDILSRRHPQLDVRYQEIPGYGHVDPVIGTSSQLTSRAANRRERRCRAIPYR